MSSINRLKKLHEKCLYNDELPQYVEKEYITQGNPINSVDVSGMNLEKLKLKNALKTNDRFYYNKDTNRYYEIPNGERDYFDVTDDFNWDVVLKTNTIQNKMTNTQRLNYHRRYEVIVEKRKIYCTFEP